MAVAKAAPACHAMASQQKETPQPQSAEGTCCGHCKPTLTALDQSLNTAKVFAQLLQQFPVILNTWLIELSSKKPRLFPNFDGPPDAHSLPIYLAISNLRL